MKLEIGTEAAQFPEEEYINAEVGGAIFLGGALSLEWYLFFLRPLALDRNDFKFASALSAIPL